MSDLPARITEWESPAGPVERGQVVRIRGERGRWKFLNYVEATQPHVEVISLNGSASIRAFTPDRVKQVVKAAATAPNRLRKRRPAGA